MKVLMFGWEFPPHNSGGLGVACQGLIKGLNNQNAQVTLVLPQYPEELNLPYAKVLDASRLYGRAGIKIKRINTLLAPYLTSLGYDEALRLAKLFKGDPNYGANIYDEARRYAEQAKLIAQAEDFDVIHCHDWMTYQAGLAAKQASGKPLVVHIHATEFDRTGGNNNQYIYDVEKEGFVGADKILAVSQYTKNKVCYHYGIPPEKVAVVHNAVEFNHSHEPYHQSLLKKHHKTVLFVGRITIQKGPDWLLAIAKKVLDQDPDIKFVMAGSGDMELFIIEKAAELGIANNFLFAGFARGRELEKLYQNADLFIMPSISEPFGITPLEAMSYGVPSIISKQSGVAEVFENSIKVDFWDIDKMAASILEVLHNPEYYNRLRSNGLEEIKKFDWNIPARKCLSVYEELRGPLW